MLEKTYHQPLKFLYLRVVIHKICVSYVFRDLHFQHFLSTTFNIIFKEYLPPASYKKIEQQM